MMGGGAQRRRQGRGPVGAGVGWQNGGTRGDRAIVLTNGADCGGVVSQAASDVYAPVSGKVVECNKTLSENPGMVSGSLSPRILFCIALF